MIQKAFPLIFPIVALFLLSCQDSNPGGGTPLPEPVEKDYELPRAKFESLAAELQEEVDQKGKIHFDAYAEMASVIRNIYVQIDDSKKQAQVSLISFRGYRCLFNPSPIDDNEAWVSVGDKNKANCEASLQEAEVNVVAFEDGYVIRVRGIVTANIQYIALTRMQDLIVNDLGESDPTFSQLFLGKRLKAQASHAVFPESLQNIRRNSFYISEKLKTSLIWAGADQSEKGQISFLARSINIGMGLFHEAGSEFEGEEVVAYAKEASLKYDTQNYMLDIHRILKNDIQVQSNEAEVSALLKIKFVEE